MTDGFSSWRYQFVDIRHFVILLFFIWFCIMGLRDLKLGDQNCIIAVFYQANIQQCKAFTVQYFMVNHDLKRTAIYNTL